MRSMKLARLIWVPLLAFGCARGTVGQVKHPIPPLIQPFETAEPMQVPPAFWTWQASLIRAYCQGRDVLLLANGEDTKTEGVCRPP